MIIAMKITNNQKLVHKSITTTGDNAKVWQPSAALVAAMVLTPTRNACLLLICLVFHWVLGFEQDAMSSCATTRHVFLLSSSDLLPSLKTYS